MIGVPKIQFNGFTCFGTLLTKKNRNQAQIDDIVRKMQHGANFKNCSEKTLQKIEKIRLDEPCCAIDHVFVTNQSDKSAYKLQ